MIDAVQLRRQHSSGDLSFDTKKLLQNPVRRISHPAVCCPLVSASLSRTDINRQQHQGYQKSLQLILQQPQLIFILKEDNAA